MHYVNMHGAGNSFVIVEDPQRKLQGEELKNLALKLCKRENTDGMIVAVPAEDADFGMLFYNADGSLGEMCGNGARCIARYGLERGLAPNPSNIRIRATAGLVRARKLTRALYEVRLNDPSVIDLRRFAPADGETVPCAYVELGDPGIPHAVVEVEENAFDDTDALRRRGRALRNSPAFPRGANVSFVCLTGEDRVRAITYERGVEDFTCACGTGAGAIALSLSLAGKLSGDRVAVYMPGGCLAVRLRYEGGRVSDLYLTGPTAVTGEGDQ